MLFIIFVFIDLSRKGLITKHNNNQDNWSLDRQFNDMNIVAAKMLEGDNTVATADDKKTTPGMFVPPLLPNGPNKSLSNSVREIKNDNTMGILVSNLSENIHIADIKDLIKTFGSTRKLYLPKHKETGLYKGFAYVQFKKHEDAVNAINALDGHWYGGVFLSADWSKLKGM